MRDRAGDRGVDAALDARAPADAPPRETADQAKRRRLRRAKVQARSYLSKMRRAGGDR